MNNKKTAIVLAVAVVILAAAYVYLSTVKKPGIPPTPTTAGTLPDLGQMAGNLDEQTERQVQIKFPDDINVGSVNTYCEDLKPDSAETIVIAKAEDVEKCHKPHYRLQTKTPAETVKSMIENYRQDSTTKEGDSHAFEIDDLATIYSYLLSEKEVKELEKLAQENNETGATAQALLKTYGEALKTQAPRK